MQVLLAAETLLLVLLVLLVAGLLRSHAEILRRLGPPAHEEGPALEVVASPAPAAAPARGTEPPALDVAGITMDGDAVQVGLAADARPTLLAFLSSGCVACRPFWEGFVAGEPALPKDVRLLIVPEDGSRESPSRLRRLAPPGSPVVLSSVAWADYAVPASPYFVLTAGGRIRGEGSAEGWAQLASLLADALDDERTAGGGSARARRAETTLAAAGILPGHPSLRPPEQAGE
jgi:hypothetical protein